MPPHPKASGHETERLGSARAVRDTTVSTVLDVYETALGATPSACASSSRRMRESDLWAILSARAELTSRDSDRARRPHEIWPLLSHHTYDRRGLFGQAGNRDLLPRTLALLLVHDGLVAADPLESVRQLVKQNRTAEAIRALDQATKDLAEVEALISAGVLRLSASRPKLGDDNREAVLKTFGLDSSMRVFTDFLEASAAVDEIPGSFSRLYAPQVKDLYSKFGIRIQEPRDLPAALENVKSLAAAIIEVSWQFSVGAVEPNCDMTFRGPIERRLAEEVVTEGISELQLSDVASTRHFTRLDLGGIPNLEHSRLSLADALAIRRDDSFEEFRAFLRKALDRLESDEAAGVESYVAREVFEESMREHASGLKRSVRRTSLTDRVKDGVMPTALAVLAEFALSPLGPGHAASGAAAVSVGTVVWQWLIGRQESEGIAAARRYCALLGADRSGVSLVS